jgi:hypothetical protein
VETPALTWRSAPGPREPPRRYLKRAPFGVDKCSSELRGKVSPALRTWTIWLAIAAALAAGRPGAAQEVVMPASAWRAVLDSVQTSAKGLRVCIDSTVTPYAPDRRTGSSRTLAEVLPERLTVFGRYASEPDCCLPGDTTYLDVRIFEPTDPVPESRVIAGSELGDSALEVVVVAGARLRGIANGRHYVLSCTDADCAVVAAWSDLADWVGIRTGVDLARAPNRCPAQEAKANHGGRAK